MDYVIGLGSNLGDRLDWLARAAARLKDLGRIDRASPVYESAAVGGPEQGPFLNAALVLASPHPPLALLRELLSIEQALGRVRRERWGPRTIDLDVLWADRLVLDAPELAVPHPRLPERVFALRPLLDVVPAARDPRTGELYAAVLERLDTTTVRLVAGAREWLATAEIP